MGSKKFGLVLTQLSQPKFFGLGLTFFLDRLTFGSDLNIRPQYWGSLLMLTCVLCLNICSFASLGSFFKYNQIFWRLSSCLGWSFWVLDFFWAHFGAYMLTFGLCKTMGSIFGLTWPNDVFIINLTNWRIYVWLDQLSPLTLVLTNWRLMNWRFTNRLFTNRRSVKFYMFLGFHKFSLSNAAS